MSFPLRPDTSRRGPGAVLALTVSALALTLSPAVAQEGGIVDLSQFGDATAGVAADGTVEPATEGPEAAAPGAIALGQVVVTASGFEQNVADAPASISVIPREQLETGQFRDLTDALRTVQGVSVTGNANEKDIYIRGLPGAYTLILVDGVRQNTRESRPNGSSGYEQNFIPPLEAIDRIEVLRGPASTLYGSEAVGGVINIITRRVPERLSGSVIRGVELTAGWDPTDSLSLLANYTYTDSEQKTGDYAGFALARTPEHQANARADWFTSVEGLSVYAAGFYHGEETNAGLRIGASGKPVYDGDGNLVARKYPDYFTADIGTTYEISQNVTINAAVYNLFDEEVTPDEYNTVVEGRRFWASLKASF